MSQAGDLDSALKVLEGCDQEQTEVVLMKGTILMKKQEYAAVEALVESKKALYHGSFLLGKAQFY